MHLYYKDFNLLFLCPGGVKVALNVGFEYDEVNTDIQNVDLANNQQHVVLVRRFNKGRSLGIYVSADLVECMIFKARDQY